MKRMLCLAVLLATCFTIAYSQAGTQALQNELSAIERQAWEAWKNRDVKFFDRFLANPTVVVGPTGIEGTRTDVLKEIGGHDCVVSSYSLGDFKLTMFDINTALLTYKATLAATCGGQPIPNELWSSTLYVRRDGRWLLAFHQQTAATEPIREPARSRTQPTKVIDNDIGKSKKNAFFEITVENAWTSTDRVRDNGLCACFGGCYVDIPAGQKAVLVRVAIRVLSIQTLSDIAPVKPSNFLLVDDWNKRVEPVCQNFPIYLKTESAYTVTLLYATRMESRRLIFRFQKVGAGEAIAFDLSDLD